MLGDDAQGYLCEKCVVDNAVAYDVLCQHIATGYANDTGQYCQECYRGLDAIERMTGRRSLYLHVKDGIKQLLCAFCSRAYELKATNLYRNTQYGWIKKLDGNK